MWRAVSILLILSLSEFIAGAFLQVLAVTPSKLQCRRFAFFRSSFKQQKRHWDASSGEFAECGNRRAQLPVVGILV